MKTRVRDVVWAAAGGLVVIAMIGSAVAIIRGNGDVVKLVVGIIPASFLVVGCWRRTKWGAPEGGLRQWQEDRKTGRGVTPET